MVFLRTGELRWKGKSPVEEKNRMSYDFDISAEYKIRSCLSRLSYDMVISALWLDWSFRAAVSATQYDRRRTISFTD